MTLKERMQDIHNMMAQGQVVEAYDKYYHEDIVKVEANGDAISGKAANRKALEEWVSGVKEFHGGGVNAITADEENKVTMAEEWTEVTLQDGTRLKMEQVAVQHWEDGQIKHERFYYHMPSQG